MKIKELTPNPNNPRKITDDKLTMLKKALVEFGDLSGIVYNRRTKQLVGGHQRSKLFDTDSEITLTKEYPKPTQTGTVAEGFGVLSGERFSYREVDWPKHKEMAANIAANKGAGIWDMPQLGEWLKELNSFDVDIDLNLTMFDDDELSDFDGITVKEHVRTGPTGVDEDEIPEKAPARTKLGDIYRLGDHRLMCGDSTDAKSIRQLMKGEKADIDAAYGKRMKGKQGFISRSNKVYNNIIGDDQEFDPTFVLSLFSDAKIFLWGANNYTSKLPKGQWLVWYKKTTPGMKKMFGWDFELCWTNQTAGSVYEQSWAGCFGHNIKLDGDTKTHPSMKSVSLIEQIFNDYESVTCLDLFGGSGSTLIACEKTGRKCFMMELDPSYCDVIIDRFEKYTGKQAKKLSVKPILKKASEMPISSRA